MFQFTLFNGLNKNKKPNIVTDKGLPPPPRLRTCTHLIGVFIDALLRGTIKFYNE